MKKIIIVLILSLISKYSCAQKYNIILKLTKGQEYNVNIITNQTITQKILNKEEHTIKKRTQIKYLYQIIENNNTNETTIKGTYLSIAYRQESENGTITFDSNNPENLVDMEIRGFSALPGNSFIFKIDTNANITFVAGANSILEKMIAAYGITDPNLINSLRQTLGKQFSDEGVKLGLQNMLNFYPKTPQKINANWNKNSFLNIMFPLYFTQIYTLKDVESKLAIIEGESNLSTNGFTPKQEINGLKISYNTKGHQSSSTQIDLETGIPVFSEQHQVLKGSVKITTSNSDTEALIWPILIESSTITKIKF